MKVDKSVQVTLIIVAAVMVLAFMFYSTLPQTSANTVTGNGQATVKVMPDLVSVYFNVETKGNSSKVATDENTKIVNDLTLALMNRGFNKEDIETTNFNVYPDYTYTNNQRKENGYIATHGIRVLLPADDFEEIGIVVDEGVNAGAGISYISFELSQELQNQYKAEALKLASQDARIKAEAIAEGLGKELGSLVSTSGNDFNYYPWRIYESAGAASMDSAMIKEEATSIQPGEQEVSASVTAVFKLN